MQETHSTRLRPTEFQESQSEPGPIAQRPRLIVTISVLLTFLTCYLREFVLPNVPIMSWGDHVLYATNGARILAGQMPYRDYFTFLTPGTDLIYSLLFRWFGLELWIPNLTMACLAPVAVWLMMLAARRVLHGMALALPSLFFIGFGLFGSLDATHHWFSTIAATAAMLVLMRDIQPRHIAFAGALCGVAASFTQTKGVLVTLGFRDLPALEVYRPQRIGAYILAQIVSPLGRCHMRFPCHQPSLHARGGLDEVGGIGNRISTPLLPHHSRPDRLRPLGPPARSWNPERDLRRLHLWSCDRRLSHLFAGTGAPAQDRKKGTLGPAPSDRDDGSLHVSRGCPRHHPSASLYRELSRNSPAGMALEPCQRANPPGGPGVGLVIVCSRFLPAYPNSEETVELPHASCRSNRDPGPGQVRALSLGRRAHPPRGDVLWGNAYLSSAKVALTRPDRPARPVELLSPRADCCIDCRTGREQSPFADPQCLLGRPIDMELQSR
jgi:hypothetical protein